MTPIARIEFNAKKRWIPLFGVVETFPCPRHRFLTKSHRAKITCFALDSLKPTRTVIRKMGSDSDPSTTELLDPKNEEGWEDVESDVEDQTFKSLFDDKWFGDITEMLKYDQEKYSFDYVKLKNQLSWCNAAPSRSIWY